VAVPVARVTPWTGGRSRDRRDGERRAEHEQDEQLGSHRRPPDRRFIHRQVTPPALTASWHLRRGGSTTIVVAQHAVLA
jgi:hypothetical protein